MTDTDLTPALTAEEWGRRWCVRVDTTVSINKYGLVVVNDGSDDSSGRAEIGADAEHAAIALTNAALPDGDPKKITHEMVSALAWCVGAVHSEWTDTSGALIGDEASRHVPAAGAAVRALASLLPPRSADRA